jgi:hypothetical protein
MLTTLNRSIIDAHKKYLTLGQPTAFNTIYETQQFVSAVSFNQVRPPKVWWSEDFTTLSVDGKTLILGKFRDGIRAAFKAAWDIYNKITGHQRFATLIPTNFKDNLGDDTRDYSFLSHGPFTHHPHALLAHVIQERRLSFVDGSGRVSWNKPALRQLFDEFRKLNALWCCLSYILPTISTRITQFLDHKYRNDNRTRNLHTLLKDMFFIIKYHKMTNLTGRDACIPAFFPDVLKELSLEILAGGLRDCEAILAPILYGREAKQLYDV